MAEAEGVLAGKLRPVGADQLLADERGEPRRDLRSSERAPGRRRGGRSRPRPRRARAPALARLELVEAGGEQSPQRRRDVDLALRLAGHGEHLGDEERVAAGRAAIRSRSSAGSCSPISSSTSSSRQRLEPDRHRPRGAAVEQLRPGNAERAGSARRRRAAPRARRGRGTSPRPTGCRRRRTTSGACSSSSLRNAQAISSADVARVRLAEQRANRGRRGRVGGKRVELLDHLDDRPVRDPLAVGQAAAADDACIDRRRALRRRGATCRRRRRRRP